MAFKKFRADQLFDGYHMRDSQWVLVTSESGIVEEMVNVRDAGDDIQTLTGILTPGFVNCHCHLELSHMKGLIPERTGLSAFLTGVMKSSRVADANILQAIEDAETSMIREGIVAVGDICNTTNTLKQKSLRRLWYHNFIETMGFQPELAASRFQRALELFSAFADQYRTPVASVSIVPHAPYSVSEELWRKIIAFPGNQLLTIHNQEAPEENELFLDKRGDFLSFYENFKIDITSFIASGKTSLQTYLSRFLPNQSVILVHNVQTNEADIRYAASSPANFHWCLCPNANLYISAQLPDVSLFLENNCNLVLGTDSLASNQQLSIVAEMKTLIGSFPDLTHEHVLTWATSNGARALQLDELLGSFEKGKQPGIVLCDHLFNTAQRLL